MRLPGIVAIEGIDGSGKATQAKLLADCLDGRSWAGSPTFTAKPCLRRSFPAYGTELGGLIAGMLKEDWRITNETECGPDADMNIDHVSAFVLQCLMTVNRLELADEIEYRNSTEGLDVVLDRYWASAVAYGAADGLDPKWLEAIHSRLPKAHHVLIDVPVDESWKRRPERRDVYEADRGRLERAREEYLALWERKGVDTAYWAQDLKGAREGCGRDGRGYRVSPSGWAIVNGLGTSEEVHARVKGALEIP